MAKVKQRRPRPADAPEGPARRIPPTPRRPRSLDTPRYARSSRRSSTRSRAKRPAARRARAILLDIPAAIDAGEITDKGSINQRAVLKARAALVEELYADAPGARIIAAAKESR